MSDKLIEWAKAHDANEKDREYRRGYEAAVRKVVAWIMESPLISDHILAENIASKFLSAPAEPPNDEMPDMKTRVYIWLGYWRDRMPPEAVSELQNILGPMTATPPAEPPEDVSRGFTPEEAKAHRRFVDEFFPAAEVCEWEWCEEYGGMMLGCRREITKDGFRKNAPCHRCGLPVRIKPADVCEAPDEFMAGAEALFERMRKLGVGEYHFAALSAMQEELRAMKKDRIKPLAGEGAP